MDTMFVYMWKKIYSNIFSKITINKYFCLHFSEMYDLSLSTQDIKQNQEHTSF